LRTAAVIIAVSGSFIIVRASTFVAIIVRATVISAISLVIAVRTAAFVIVKVFLVTFTFFITLGNFIFTKVTTIIEIYKQELVARVPRRQWCVDLKEDMIFLVNGQFETPQGLTIFTLS